MRRYWMNWSNNVLSSPIQTNVDINKPYKLTVNQTNPKFIETLNNDRVNTVKAHMNTMIQVTNTNDIKQTKIGNTSISNSGVYIYFI
jgi:hypothetical protein